MEESILNNVLGNKMEVNVPDKDLQIEQKGFLETNLGQAVNFAMDIGLRALLPDFAEGIVINIKDTLMKEGITDGIKEVINSGINLGKSVVGIFTGNFENMSQVQNAITKGGIIDSTSSLLDNVLDQVQKKNLISKEIIGTIKKGKDVILDNVSKNIEEVVTKQIKEIEKIEKYSENWKEHYNNKDFDKMEKEYNKLQKSLKQTIPLEETLKNAREIENLHKLIKNNGKDFNIKPLEAEVAKKLS